MVAVAVAMLAQSLDLREIVAQQGSYPFFLVLPLGLAPALAVASVPRTLPLRASGLSLSCLPGTRRGRIEAREDNISGRRHSWGLFR